MNIIDYDSKYDEDIKDLLVELHEYIVSIDKYKYNRITDSYREIEFENTFKDIKEHQGRMLLAVDNNKAIGLVIGTINNEEEATFDFKAPKRGRITELIVSNKYRATGIGKQLMNEIENHLKNVGCKAILIEVFAYNENAKRFYYNRDYSDRVIDVMKEI